MGAGEIRWRKTLGWLGAALVVVFLGLAMGLHWNRYLRLLVFVPATMSAGGYFQAAWHFCAKFGLGGVFNVGPNVGKTDTVEQAEFRRLDRITSIKIIALSLLTGGAVAAVAFFLPA